MYWLFPVDPEPLRDLVSGMTMATIAEAKTCDPMRHADLQLADIGAEDGAGSEAILMNAEGDTLAHMIAGQHDLTLDGVTGGQFAQRSGEDAPAWFRISASGETETAAALGAKTGGFYFSLNRSDAEIFGWTLDDLSEETAS